MNGATPQNPTDARIVFCTSASGAEAERISRHLVEERLAACVNIISSVRSVFRWQDEVQTASEYLLIIKTTSARYPALQDAITRMHSYEVPECIMIPIVAGLPGYLEWIQSETSDSPEEADSSATIEVSTKTGHHE